MPSLLNQNVHKFCSSVEPFKTAHLHKLHKQNKLCMSHKDTCNDYVKTENGTNNVMYSVS